MFLPQKMFFNSHSCCERVASSRSESKLLRSALRSSGAVLAQVVAMDRELMRVSSQDAAAKRRRGVLARVAYTKRKARRGATISEGSSALRPQLLRSEIRHECFVGSGVGFVSRAVFSPSAAACTAVPKLASRDGCVGGY